MEQTDSRGFSRLRANPGRGRRDIWRWGAILLLGLLPGVLHAADDFQFRAEGHLTVPAVTNLKIQIGSQYRWDDQGSFTYQHTDVGLAYTGLAKWMDLGLFYKLVYQKTSSETWSYVALPNFNATARFRIRRLAFSNRLRFEYSSPEVRFSDFSTIRNRLMLNPPIYLEVGRAHSLLGPRRFRPYASYEFYYTVDIGKISRHQFRGGLSFLFGSRFVSSLYYMRQETEIEDGFQGLNIIGLDLNLLF